MPIGQSLGGADNGEIFLCSNGEMQRARMRFAGPNDYHSDFTVFSLWFEWEVGWSFVCYLGLALLFGCLCGAWSELYQF
jgi:hypothetical protein